MENNRRGRRRKIILAIISVPFILVWTLAALLYIPAIQQYAVGVLCREISESTGYGIHIGSVHLSPPLRLRLEEISMSRGDTLYAHGARAAADVSLLPLLTGKAEVNYIELEQLALDTRELIPGVAVKGEVDYLRAVARDIDLARQDANIRQVHLHGARLGITVTGTPPDGNEESTLPAWNATLRKGTIEECSIALHLPADTLSLSAHIGRLSIENGTASIAGGSCSLGKAAISGSSIRYDKGSASKEEAPLSHITLEEIALECSSLAFSPHNAGIGIDAFTFTQPGGMSLAGTRAEIVCDTSALSVRQLQLHSKNGSRLSATGSVPWQALTVQGCERLKASLEARVCRSDLDALLTAEQRSALSLFGDSMLAAHISLHGNLSALEIDTMNVTAPSLAAVSAKGCLKELYKGEKMTAMLELDGEAYDIRRFISKDTVFPGNSGHATAKGTLQYNAGTLLACIGLQAAGGSTSLKALYDLRRGSYSASIAAKDLNISKVMPSLPLERISMSMDASGQGFDIFSDSTAYSIALAIDTLCYNGIEASGITASASQANSLSRITANGNSPALQFGLEAETTLHAGSIRNSTALNVGKADLTRMHITSADLAMAFGMDLELSTDLGERHSVSLSGKDIKIFTGIKTFTPKEITASLYTAPDSTSLIAANGDLKVSGSMDSGYHGLLLALQETGSMFIDALAHDNMVHYLQDYQELLPRLHFSFSSGRDNMLSSFLAIRGITASNMRMDIDMDTVTGLSLRAGIYGFRKGSLNLDTIRMFTRQEGDRISYFAGVHSTALDPQDEKQTYSAGLYGSLANDSLTANLMLRDKAGRIGARIGAAAQLRPYGLSIGFAPGAVLLGEEFTFSKGNYIDIGKGMSVEADVTLSDRHGAGMHLYTTPDEEYTHNASLELFNVNLKKLTGVIPYAPDIAGTLGLDLSLKNGSKGLMLSADAYAEALEYEGVHIGNEIIEAVYFPKDGNQHYIDLRLLHDEEEAVRLSGNYQGNDAGQGLDGSITLTRFPLAISKAFIQDTGISLDGYLNGSMSARGRLSRLTANGRVQFESASIDAYTLGASLHMPDETLEMEDNRLLFKDFDIYAKGDSPFRINGSVDFSTLLNPTFSLRMSASDYELVNTPRRKGAMLYGRLLVDIRAMIGGTLEKMRMYGDVTMKSKSNITYVIQEAPIESDKELDGLVEFVDFRDTTAVAARQKEIDLGDIDLSLSLAIADGARINADLDAARNSYVTTEGSGSLHLAYTGESGINVTGSYAMRDGEFKLSLPVIPLKTLNISDGSEVRWSGALLDPGLDITALERVTSSVTFDDNNTSPVPFDVGVKVTGTLDQMGLSFIISSPENPIVQEQLNALDTEGMNRYAVTMLLTGTYAGSSKNMTVSNALSSFIDAKINDIAGTALKSVSVNVGINDATNAETGSTYKNYSFSFSKRFWNDRITLSVGGEVNSGDAPRSSNSFINNASLEWKISENSNRYLRLFYDKNYESILEGEITETGIGYVYRRKLSRLKELFIFRNARKEQAGTKPQREQ